MFALENTTDEGKEPKALDYEAEQRLSRGGLEIFPLTHQWMF